MIVHQHRFISPLACSTEKMGMKEITTTEYQAQYSAYKYTL